MIYLGLYLIVVVFGHLVHSLFSVNGPFAGSFQRWSWLDLGLNLVAIAVMFIYWWDNDRNG